MTFMIICAVYKSTYLITYLRPKRYVLSRPLNALRYKLSED